ncbi:uncharacterized protein LOC116209626 [Punica granatum]|uniref:DC1 domain-containing protein n=2 Tax=Punica granatum TaxID=22663 RepID=A0A218XE94_PUNGR|nr:uncharacterized protein LOC116209626 [Punica granatum]OWM82652.1 hypothetical protein CDL15_Pgr002227 [Punica granatum]PKI54178.1 hypothetical protein CRG98_025411 [Punica granatum]
MSSLNGAAEQQRPTFTHLAHHHPLELANGLNNHLVSCSGCTLPILGGKDYYTCRPCSFSLHSSCFKMPPSLRHPSHPAHELRLSCSSTTAAPCQACAQPIAPSSGGGFFYSCQFCPVHFHSLCLFRPVSISHPFHPVHELSLKFSSPYGAGVGFRCDVCGNPGLPDQWLYRCDMCDFDIHAECSAATSAVTTTRSALTAGSPGGAPPQPPLPAGYPPSLPPTNSGVAYQGATTVQLQQPQPAVGMGMNQTQLQSWSGYQQPAGVGAGMTQAPPQVIGGGYSNPMSYPIQTVGAVPVAPAPAMGMGMGMGTLVMAGVATGVGEGIGQGIFQSTASAFGGHDSSGLSDQHII